MIPILYLTCEQHHNLIPDEMGIKPFFAHEGMQLDIKVWDKIDWTAYHNILIRTPWDYPDKHEDFLKKIHHAEAAGANIINSGNIIRWNIDKQYLVDLFQMGFDIVPTYLDNHFQLKHLAPYFAKHSTLVLKPRVGGAGKNTFKVQQHDDLTQLAPLLKKPVLIQPFIPEIETSGEYSFIFFGETFSHAIIKKPKTGEFRVQAIYGGTITSYTPSTTEIAYAENLLKSLKLDTTYARVDLVKHRHKMLLMELEIIEPELFFKFSTTAMAHFAKSVKNRLKQPEPKLV